MDEAASLAAFHLSTQQSLLPALATKLNVVSKQNWAQGNYVPSRSWQRASKQHYPVPSFLKRQTCKHYFLETMTLELVQKTITLRKRKAGEPHHTAGDALAQYLVGACE